MVIPFASARVKAVEKLPCLKRNDFSPFSLSYQLFLYEEVGVFRKTVDVHIDSIFFDEEKLQLLIKLLIDLGKFANEDVYSLSWHDVVVHQDFRKGLYHVD